MIKSLLFFLFFSFVISEINAQPWFEKSNYGGVARHRTSAFSLGNYGYIGLGHINSGVDVEYEDFWKYDPASDSWSQIANYPEGRCYHAASFTIGSKAYVGSGRLESGAYSKKFFCYDPQTNSWTPIADLPGAARRGAVAFTVGEFGYVGTGQLTGGFSADFYRYNPVLNQWNAIAIFPGLPRTSSVAFSIGEFGYVGTGQTSQGSRNDFYQYRPDLNQWVLKAPVGPTNRQEATGFALNGKGYIGTGDDFSSGNNFSDFWEYDPFLNTWLQIEDFAGTARRYLTCFTIGSRAYAGTGTNGTNFRDFWMFDQILSVLTRAFEDVNLSIYPNPSSDQLTIDLEAMPADFNISDMEIRIVNLTGNCMLIEKIEQDKSTFDVSKIPSGNYIVQLLYQGNSFKTSKLIIAS
jgi:N-acetylneuraminic acid mutarotase